MKYCIYIKEPYEAKELQIIVHEKEEVRKAIDMLETYYDMYSPYLVFYELVPEPVYSCISELKSKYLDLGK